MKKKYTNPVIVVVELNASDVIACSTTSYGESSISYGGSMDNVVIQSRDRGSHIWDD